MKFIVTYPVLIVVQILTSNSAHISKNSNMEEKDLSAIVLDPEKCKELNDLGVCCLYPCIWWERHINIPTKIWEPWKVTTKRPTLSNTENYNVLSAFTLQELLEMLPKTIVAYKDGSKLPLMITITGSGRYAIVYCNPYYKNGKVGLTISESLLEAAFNILKWCKQNNYI